MIDFATLQGLEIEEGVVTQVEDAAGNVLWKLETSKPVVLEVKKITSSTYAGETSYGLEEFILMDIYPKTNGTVSVTYGGLTKTVTDTSGAEEPNAQQIFFGTFNGVTDSVTTPESGTLVIEGDVNGFACGAFQGTEKASIVSYCGCVTSIVSWGSPTLLAPNAFRSCTDLTAVEIPSSITAIGNNAFYNCSGITSIYVPASVASMGEQVFGQCEGLVDVIIGAAIIPYMMFANCNKIKSINLLEGVTSIGVDAFYMSDRRETAMRYGKVVFPSSLMEIKNGAFRTSEQGPSGDYYGYLGDIQFLSTSPPNMDMYECFGVYDPFKHEDGTDGTIKVPKGCGDVYREAVGGLFEKFVVEASE